MDILSDLKQIWSFRERWEIQEFPFLLLHHPYKQTRLDRYVENVRCDLCGCKHGDICSGEVQES